MAPSNDSSTATSTKYTSPPQPKSPFISRLATPADVSALTEIFFHSFNAAFWQYAIPDIPASRNWWDESWRLGIEEDPTTRTFITFDESKKSAEYPEGKPAALARWIVPQHDGNRERLWPALPEEHWDMGVMGPFFGGMEENREKLMGERPHWFLEMLGTHDDYQHCGLGSAMLEWGCSKADAEGLETYLDASERGQPFYRKHFGFVGETVIDIPDRPAYGSFVYISLIRPVQGKGGAKQGS